MNAIVTAVRKDLKANADKHTRETSQHFFKEKIKFYGVKTAIVHAIGKNRFKELKDTSKAEIFDLCEELWQSGYMEESFIACHWSYFLRKQYQPDDFRIFDTLCNHTVGEFIEMHPDHLRHLKRFTKSDNRWMRRAAAVTLIIPAKKGKFLGDILEIADFLLLDKDDLVQKGYGWMLKAASQAHEREIFAYVMKNKAVMPRTALRYAIEKMPKALKAKAMEK
jgi:3-methyladenine DNA glycosylase AlkD